MGIAKAGSSKALRREVLALSRKRTNDYIEAGENNDEGERETQHR
jgi:hypothetical protein